MTNPQAFSDAHGDALVTQGGDIVGVPSCSVCDATESPRTPLTIQPDGSYLCSLHLNRWKREALGARGASALRAGAFVEAPVAAGPARPAPPPDSPYEALDTPPDSSADEIEAAYKRLQKYWLPLRASAAQRGRAEEALESISAAYDDLMDPERRRAVDEAIRKRAVAQREARLTAVVSPLEDWPGRRVASLKEFETACEASIQDWRIGEGILKSGGLFTWVRYSLQNRDAQQAIETAQGKEGLSDMRRLNEFLYRVDPDRPYHFFSQPGVFSLLKPEFKITSIEAFIPFADAHWDLAVQHLYDGELLAWLESRASLGVYRGDSYTVREFFDQRLTLYAHGAVAGVGLELLLEFLNPDLLKPNIKVTFDGQENRYALTNWDGELAHRAVTMTVQNTTRGYYAGLVTLTAPSAKEMSPAPWLSLTSLPLEAPIPPSGSPPPRWNSTPQDVNCELKGATSRNITFYLGNFNTLTRGRTYTRTVTLQRYESSPTQASVTGTFPITLQLMRYLSGYRLALWIRGLRGGIPGMLLNGGMGYLFGWLLVLLGTTLAPHDFWTFFPPTTDFSANGSPTAMGALDFALTLLLRPFYYAIAVLGYQTPNLFAVFFGFFGFFAAMRRGHTKYSLTQDAHAVRVTARLLAVYIWIFTAVVLILNIANNIFPLYALQLLGVGWTVSVRMIAFVFDNFAYSPPPMSTFPWNGFAFYSVFFAGVSAIIAGRVIIATRRRLYKWAEKSSGSLLNPPEKG